MLVRVGVFGLLRQFISSVGAVPLGSVSEGGTSVTQTLMFFSRARGRKASKSSNSDCLDRKSQ